MRIPVVVLQSLKVTVIIASIAGFVVEVVVSVVRTAIKAMWAARSPGCSMLLCRCSSSSSLRCRVRVDVAGAEYTK